jgi:hypothetical protein
LIAELLNCWVVDFKIVGFSAVSALAKTFQKLQTFGKLIFDLWLFYLKNAQNTEGVLWILTPNFPKRKLLLVFIILS